MKLINTNSGVVIESDEPREGFIELTEEVENNLKISQEKGESIIAKYPLTEQLNIMRQTLVELCKKVGHDDPELMNMHNHISSVLERPTEDVDVNPKRTSKKQ